MKLSGKEIQKTITSNLEEREHAIPPRVYDFLGDLEKRVKNKGEIDLFHLLVQVIIESRDLSLLTTMGDLLSCLTWDSLETSDKYTIHEVGMFIKDTSKERQYLSFYH